MITDSAITLAEEQNWYERYELDRIWTDTTREELNRLTRQLRWYLTDLTPPSSNTLGYVSDNYLWYQALRSTLTHIQVPFQTILVFHCGLLGHAPISHPRTLGPILGISTYKADQLIKDARLRLSNAFNTLRRDGDPPRFNPQTFDPLRTPIEALPLPCAMPYNTLRRAGKYDCIRRDSIRTIGDLNEWTLNELLSIENCGTSTIELIDRALRALNQPGVAGFRR
jgi:hypothetical protein